MTADKTIPALLLILFLAFAIPSALFFRKLPLPELTPSERELASFTDKPVAMSSLQPPNTFSGLINPVTASPKQEISDVTKSAVTIPAPSAVAKSTDKIPARSLGSLPVVSMISYDESSRMAIIDNRVVNEGSELDGGVIVKIEKSRVLMRKAGRNLWLTIE